LNNSGKVEVLIPRSLFSFDNQSHIHVDNEGFSAVKIIWKDGKVTNIKSLNKEVSLPKEILFPRFVESHAHFDKSFSWTNFPNFKSNYENALSVNLEEHITRTPKKVLDRAEKSLNLAISNGYRAIRTHIDTYYSQDKEIWSGLFDLKNKYSHFLKLQFVALAQLEFWSSSDGDILARELKLHNGILGGVLVPPFNKRKAEVLLTNTLLLAKKYNLEIDLHIDESSVSPAAGIRTLIKTIDRLKSNVPITCSHSSSILCLKERQILKLGKELAKRNIKVIALPLTNFWLLNRDDINMPLRRPVAPVKQLQRSFVDVSIGSDNVQDPWYPFGDFDPFYLFSYAMPMLQLNPWDRLSLSALINAPSRLLKLDWDGVVMEGCPADFVIVKGKAWADIFSGKISRKILINGEWYKK